MLYYLQRISDRKRFAWLKEQGEGFTLFEILIAISIGMILIMAGTYAIRLGLSSMEKERVWFRDFTREKAAFDFLWQQISSIRIQKVSKEDGDEENVYFTGRKDALSFITPLSLKRHYGHGLVIALYKVKSDKGGKYDLVYTEKRLDPMVFIDDRWLNNPEVWRDYTTFFTGCDRIMFTYLDSDKGGQEYGFYNGEADSSSIEGTGLQWKGKINGRIPKAVKLSVRRRGEEQVLVSPVMVMYSSLVFGQ